MQPASPLTRRKFVALSGATAAGLALAAGADQARAADAKAEPTAALTPDQILRRLLEGNRRFRQGKAVNPRRQPADFVKLAEGQRPPAVIVGCADSRVPPEILFDQGVGDLFVVRVAGNVVSGAGAILKGSVEYAVAELGVSLVVVLGHSHCGAVKAALKHIDARDALPGAIQDLVNAIKPAVAQTKGRGGDALENAIKANVKLGVARLQGLKPILAGPVKQGKVKVVGGVYDLRTGGVTVVA
jgi:carbonic anhydrase